PRGDDRHDRHHGSDAQGEDRHAQEDPLDLPRPPLHGFSVASRAALYARRVSSRPSVGDSTTTSSPGFSQTCGWRTLPTPAGVPVETMSPGSSVISLERYATSAGMPWMRSAVDADCIVSPFSVSEISIASCGPASSGV